MKIIQILFVIIFLCVSCSPIPKQSPDQMVNTNSPTQRVNNTLDNADILTPTIIKTDDNVTSPTATQSIPTLTAEEATLEAYGTKCEPPDTEKYYTRLSPDGKWIAATCRVGNSPFNSYLRVINIQGNENWKILNSDYSKSEEGYGGDIYPMHWSMNGKYVYVVSSSRFSGCCWIGSILLLVRLNLENGQQTEIINHLNDVPLNTMGLDISFSPSDRYLVYFSEDGSNILYILDLFTWEQKKIKIQYKNTGAGYSLMSNDDKKIVIVLREYPEVYQGDLTYGSIVLIDLQNGFQEKILAGMEFEDTPLPVRWQDGTHVVVTDKHQERLLDIQSSKLEEIKFP